MIYIGAHSIRDLNDDYMGSGTRLKNAIIKYGVSNFKREILEEFTSSSLMYNREKELVNEEFVKRPDTYNIRLGGNGGWYHNNSRKEFMREACSRGGKNAINRPRGWHIPHEQVNKLANAPEVRARALITYRETITRNKSYDGERNSMYGKSWICNDELKLSKPVPRSQVQSYLNSGWRMGRIL